MFTAWTDNIKKRVSRYLLQRYLGQYLQEKLTLDQLTVDLYNGTGNVTNVELDCEALNALAEQQNIPIEFIEGHLDNISVSIPWSSIMNDSCEIEINGLQITVQPKKRLDNGSSMLDSMWASMASSMQLAEECLKTGDSDDEPDFLVNQTQEPSQRLTGLETCAQTIDAMLSRVKMILRDSIIRIERSQTGGDVGIAVDFKIKLLKFSDEATTDTREEIRSYETAFSQKKITLEGVSCFSDIFKINHLSFNRRKDSSFEENSMDSLKEDDEDNAVLIGKFSGRHEIKIQIKNDDSIGGPQIILDCTFGSLIALMTPIQVHTVYRLIDELLNPALASDSVEFGGRRYCKEKPMDSFDYKRVEEELQDKLNPGRIGLPGLQQPQGWSSPCLDDSDEEFLPFKSKAEMYSSVNSTFMNASATSISSSIQQSMSESTCSTTLSSKFYNTSQKSGLQHSQNFIEKTKFCLSFASVAVVLLNEDILILSPTYGVDASSVQSMKKFSFDFFQQLGLFGATVSGKKDIDKVRTQLSNACSSNNLRFISAPLKVEGAINIVSSNSITTGHISLGYCELVESVIIPDSTLMKTGPDIVEIINFPNFDSGSCNSARIEFNHKSYKSRASISKTKLCFNLQPFKSEVDISIIDRIYSLLHPQLPFYTESKADQLRYKDETNANSRDSSVVKIKLQSSQAEVNFRFPIPDLRPVEDSQRPSSKNRNIRNDSVIFLLKDLKFETVLNSNSNITELDTKCNELQLFYKETQSQDPIIVAKALADDPELDGTSLRCQGFDWPRVLVSIYPSKPPDTVIDHEHTDEGESIDNYLSTKQKEPSPFSSRRVIHQCLSSQEKENNTEGFGESVIPGDRNEMNEFVEAASRNTIYKVEIDLRYLEVSLSSKHMYEEIYNRISTDLLLWEPSIPVHFNKGSDMISRNNFGAQTLLPMCKPGAKCDSESESEEEMTAFYNPNETNIMSSHGRKPGQISSNGQSDLTFHLKIAKGICSFYTPFVDPIGNTVPGQKGQISLIVEQGDIFVVSGYKGNSNLGYMCLHSHKAAFYHSDFFGNGEKIPVFNEQLQRTIFPSEDGVLTRLNSDSGISDHMDILSVAIRIERDYARNVKTFKVAMGIKDGTLEHRMSHPNRSWFTQLKDFFDVTDTPIMGYTPASVLTELHLHLWNCAVDYRPINLPLRSILTVNNFSISTNIAAQTSTSVIRFIAEDAALMISVKVDSNDLMNDYVCVMDMDFFELSLRHCANRMSTAPRMEMTASNNVLHIRTCSDSFKAVNDLITYLANNGDLTDPSVAREDEKTPYSPMKECSSEPTLIDTEDNGDRDRPMSASQNEHVHDMVAEAMRDSCLEPNPISKQKEKYISGNKKIKQTIEIHFSPDKDEDGSEDDIYSTKMRTPLPPDYPIMETSSAFPIDIQPSDEDEEEFCILENDPGVGILRKQGEPEARMLTDEPVRLIENYFSTPIGTRNILETPKHYPDPVMRYALHEMSIVWHLYGGEDFSTHLSKKYSSKPDERGSTETVDTEIWKKDSPSMYDQPEVDMAIDVLNPGVVFSKTKAFESAWEAYESPKVHRRQIVDSLGTWRTQGGKGRKLNTLVELHLYKMKFQHEIYPEGAKQASRQVIVINNIEIRDRLSSSQFNKMMYLYTSPTLPKQSHANMLVIKAAHIRPDPQLNIQECLLKISVLPIRLNIDQDALLFLYQFYTDFTGKFEGEDEDGFINKPPSHTPSVESLPVMTVNIAEADALNIGEDEDASNLLLFNDDPISQEDNVSICSKDPSVDSYKPATPIYFRQVTFSPEVPIRLDYRGKRVDMTHGPLAGLLMGLAQLSCSEIELKRISHRNGILGIDKLVAFMTNEWTTEIRKNQLPRLLGGVGPLHSFVQLFQGIRDLFWLPIEQYQKDGRIAKGIQKGANAFSTSAAMAALELTNRLVQTIQSAAEFTYDMVSPGPSVQQQRRQLSTKKKRYSQPSDIREGVTNAYNVVKEGLGDTAHTIVRVASKEHEQKGVSGAVGGVLRQIPPTVVRPIILVAEATSNVLDGFRSQLEPEFKKEAEEKWKES